MTDTVTKTEWYLPLSDEMKRQFQAMAYVCGESFARGIVEVLKDRCPELFKTTGYLTVSYPTPNCAEALKSNTTCERRRGKDRRKK